MPGPVVYVVVAAVGAVAVGMALKELVFDPYVAPRFEEWREEQKARREARRRRQRPVSPHFTHEAGGDTGDRPASVHEMKDLRGSVIDGSVSSRNLPPATGLRNRRSQANASNLEDSGLMDVPNGDDIPYLPLAPEASPWSNVPSPNSRSPTLSPSESRFELGSESATLPSTSPQTRNISLNGSRSSSPITMSSQVHLLAPEDSDAVPPSPELVPDLLDSTSISPWMSPRVQLPTPPLSNTSPFPPSQLLSPDPHPDLFAPAMSRTATDTSGSFITARSPQSEFRSFPPSAVTSPFSETFALSGDDDDEMYSFGSQSSESLPSFATEQDPHVADSNTFVVDGALVRDYSVDSNTYDDSSSDGSSDDSWDVMSEPRSGAASPRH